jgi:hypothetical protein
MKFNNQQFLLASMKLLRNYKMIKSLTKRPSESLFSVTTSSQFSLCTAPPLIMVNEKNTLEAFQEKFVGAACIISNVLCII